MNTDMIKIKNLTKKFGSFTAVDNINFNVKAGEIFGFLGANGAGKTTVIRMICGLLEPSSGMISVSGLNIYTQVQIIKTKIGYMSQKFSLYPDLTIRENIEFYGGIYGLTRKTIRKKTDELLNLLQIKKEADQLSGSLPLGWKQRLALSTALLHDPEIIILDEPTSGVGPESRRQFWLLIYELSEKKKTILVTTHNMDEAEYCHRISIMKEGKIIALDTPPNLKKTFKENKIETIFLKLVQNL